MERRGWECEDDNLEVVIAIEACDERAVRTGRHQRMLATEINAVNYNPLSLNDIGGKILVSELLKERVGLIIGEGYKASGKRRNIMSSGTRPVSKPKQKT